MKLAAIYNVWDGVELLEGSIRCIAPHVDLIIIVYQSVSNFGELYDPLKDILDAITDDADSKFPKTKFHIMHYEPRLHFGGTINETLKRNIGLDVAKEQKCTHFLHMDCDEYYDKFEELKQEYIESKADGSVCQMMTYFSLPILRFKNLDNYYVPFIHRLIAETKAGMPNLYPFYVDPTRTINVFKRPVVLLKTGYMHHFSWIRKDIERKARNSSASSNIKKSTLITDCKNAMPGMFVSAYNQELIKVGNTFKIEI